MRNQHDLCYAYSDDNGRTWQNSAGNVIGEMGKTFIHLNTPGLIVSPIPTNTGLSNQDTHYAYPDVSIHIMTFQDLQGTKSRIYHHWRTADGVWKFETLPFTGSRPKLVGRDDRTLFPIYSNRKDQLRIAEGTPAPDGSTWKWTDIPIPETQACYGDPLPDLQRWEAEEILSTYCQEEPVKQIRTRTSERLDGFPAALKVTDLRLTKKAD